jgi:transposase-like protein
MEQMMKKTRRKFDAGVKAKIALEALREESTTFVLAARHGVQPHRWSLSHWDQFAIRSLHYRKVGAVTLKRS